MKKYLIICTNMKPLDHCPTKKSGNLSDFKKNKGRLYIGSTIH